ncbi:MAG: glycine cleavage system aminomethyltransferase GcvT [Rhodospirillaceae bacterium]|jgi:aminomethyltransferase|nr:glycine cleavage system aminomethyltransferase GcvT [Rhodospirillaceae bacterium]
MVGPQSETRLKRVALHDLHVALGARMVPFAGFEMPVQYPAGIMAEHTHTRESASLFDVSHMGQVSLRGVDPAAAMETLVPGDIRALAPGRVRYTQLTNDRGGIIDDLMITNVGDYLFLVINASRRAEDLACLQGGLAGYELAELDRALFALQGPAAGKVISRFAPGAEVMPFMSSAPFVVDGCPLAVTRCGYTGEDGFEISVPSADAERMARALLAENEVEPAGLGARDTLRLEAGLCLYGNDIDETTTPVEAGLAWSIGKRRRSDGGFPGDRIIRTQLEIGADHRFVGIRPEGRAPVRPPAEILDQTGAPIGRITSGGFGPTVGGPIAMGYMDRDHAEPGTAVMVTVREKSLPAIVTPLPFVPHHYYKGEESP